MKRIFPLILCLLFVTAIQSQDLFDLNRVREVKVKFQQPNWETLLDQYKQDGRDRRLLASCTVDGVVYDSVGVRYKGNSSYFNVRNVIGSNKLPFNIKINYKKKKQRLPGGYKSLKLSNIFRDPSCLREVLSYEIAGKYMPAPKANYIKLYINDTFMGLYNSTESVGDQFLTNYYGYDNGTLFKCDPNYHAEPIKGCPKGEKVASLAFRGKDQTCYEDFYEIKSKTGWDELIDLTNTITKTPEKLGEVLNVDQALWMIAFNNVLVNLDSYSGKLCHNYYLYKDTFNVWHPILWDMNLSFGGFRFDGNGRGLTNQQMQEMSLFLHYKNDQRPLIKALLSNSLNKKIYFAHIRTMIDENFKNDQFKNRGKAVQSIIDYHVQSDKNKLYTYEAFKANLTTTAKAGKSSIIGLTELMDGRMAHLAAHPLMQKTAPTISEVLHNKTTEKILVTARFADTAKAYIAYRTKDKAPFKRVVMYDDGTHGDVTANDGKYSFEFDHRDLIQYYLIAENDKAARLSPERAAFEFHEIK